MTAVDVLRRRISGSYVVDEAGLDADLARTAGAVLGAGWRIRVDGAHRVPAGAALIVHNRVVGPPEAFAVARGLALATGRWIRFLGVPDIEPFGSALRKLGGAAAHPAEVAALLRGGHLVSVAAPRSLRTRTTTLTLPERLRAVAVDLEVPVVPVRVVRGVLPGSWRVTVSPPL